MRDIIGTGRYKIGLLGASRIAVPAVIRPAAKRADIAVHAVAASNAERANAYAKKHLIAESHGDYQALIDDPAIDLVYIGLPPHQHARWAIKALQAGKHVLCEKPIALNSEEARRMVDTALASSKSLIEAFHYRYHPFFERILSITQADAFGAIRQLEAFFNVPVAATAGEFRYKRAMGGGALMDLGCYPLHWIRSLVPGDWQILEATAKPAKTASTTKDDVDVAFTATLESRAGGVAGVAAGAVAGVVARISCTMAEDQSAGFQARLEIKSEEHRLVAHNPLQPARGSRLLVEGPAFSIEQSFDGETFPYQLDAVCRHLRSGDPLPTMGRDIVQNISLIERLYQAARSDPLW